MTLRDQDILGMWDEEFETHAAWRRYRELLVGLLTDGAEDDENPSDEVRVEADRIWKDYVRVYAERCRLEHAYVLAATNGTIALLSARKARDLGWSAISETTLEAHIRDPEQPG